MSVGAFTPGNTPPLEVADTQTDMTTEGRPNGPPDLNRYFYDKNTGMLYVWISQSDANADGASPLGNCTGNPATDPPFCTDHTTQEHYYVCPKQGCPSIRIKLNAINYLPGISNCPVFGPGGQAADWAKNTKGATWPEPPNTDQNFLVFSGTKTIAQTKAAGKSTFPFNDVTTSALDCPVSSSP